MFPQRTPSNSNNQNSFPINPWISIERNSGVLDGLNNGSMRTRSLLNNIPTAVKSDFHLLYSPKRVFPTDNTEALEKVDQQNFYNVLIECLKDVISSQNTNITSWKNPLLYKTALCRHWLRNGSCKYGLNCWYAHGKYELRFVPRMCQIPSPDQIIQYLSFLDLPAAILKTVIIRAYQATETFSKRSSLSTHVSPHPSDPVLYRPSETQTSFASSLFFPETHVDAPNWNFKNNPEFQGLSETHVAFGKSAPVFDF